MSAENNASLENVESDESTSVIDVHGSVKREKGEPRIGMEPVSLWVIFAGAIVLMVAAGYTGGLYGGFSMDNIYAVHGYTPEPPPAGPDGPQKAQQLTPEVWVQKGKMVYNSCLACHGPSGAGIPGQFPPLAGSEWVNGPTERMAVLILKGLAGPMTVKGTPYNGAMPPWEQMMSDKQIAQVMSYVRSNWGNDGGIITEEMIAVAREKYKGQPGPWDEAKLKQIPEGEEGNLPGAPVVLDDPETWTNLQK